MNDETREPSAARGLDRRDFLGALGIGAIGAAGVLAPGALAASAREDEKAGAETPREYRLPELPYAKDALDGFLSAEILELHHDKHHAGYVKGLNEALAKLHEAREKNDYASIKPLCRAVAFHGSGHALHTLYWKSMSPDGGGDPEGALLTAVNASFGSVDACRKQFAAASKQAEASGWGILAYEPIGDRIVTLAAESHQQMHFAGATPLVVCDVWEHAYYLRYQNKRGDYVDRFLDVMDWKTAGRRYERARARAREQARDDKDD